MSGGHYRPLKKEGKEKEYRSCAVLYMQSDLSGVVEKELSLFSFPLKKHAVWLLLLREEEKQEVL